MTAHATATADTAGLEPAAPRCADTVVDAGALPFRAMRPVILFWLGNLTQGWADRRPLLTVEVSGFGVAQTPTVKRDYQWSFLGRSLRPVAAFSMACFSSRSI